jgi:hypothetical protein
MLTDRELLQDCLEAFDAIPVAAKARKMLKKIGQVPGAYAGNGSHILAAKMAESIRRHLGAAE